MQSHFNSNSVSEKFREFCKILNIGQTVWLSYDQQYNMQATACIEFFNYALKGFDTYTNVNLYLL